MTVNGLGKFSGTRQNLAEHSWFKYLHVHQRSGCDVESSFRPSGSPSGRRPSLWPGPWVIGDRLIIGWVKWIWGRIRVWGNVRICWRVWISRKVRWSRKEGRLAGWRLDGWSSHIGGSAGLSCWSNCWGTPRPPGWSSVAPRIGAIPALVWVILSKADADHESEYLIKASIMIQYWFLMTQLWKVNQYLPSIWTFWVDSEFDFFFKILSWKAWNKRWVKILKPAILM